MTNKIHYVSVDEYNYWINRHLSLAEKIRPSELLHYGDLLTEDEYRALISRQDLKQTLTKQPSAVINFIERLLRTK